MPRRYQLRNNCLSWAGMPLQYATPIPLPSIAWQRRRKRGDTSAQARPTLTGQTVSSRWQRFGQGRLLVAAAGRLHTAGHKAGLLPHQTRQQTCATAPSRTRKRGSAWRTHAYLKARGVAGTATVAGRYGYATRQRFVRHIAASRLHYHILVQAGEHPHLALERGRSRAKHRYTCQRAKEHHRARQADGRDGR